ncbi:MAG: hypothetical protein JXA14_01010 [Anaerolineae bacterium]|nr:hypothetical protein [Anaerolineae bacterium]
MRFQTILISTLILALPIVLLAACASSEPTQTAAEAVSDSYTSAVLDTSYEGALNASDQLMLGTLLLEKTELAVTPDQASTLLPLWQALQGGGVTVQAEVNAVLKQIEDKMTQEQLQAIAAMQLTQDDLRAWMEEQGMGGGSPGAGGDMSDEERQAARATAQAGGGFPGGGPGGSGGEMPPDMATRQAEMANMTDEERETARATMQASGDFPGGGPGGAGGGGSSGGRQANFLLRPLIEFLTQRAAE